MKYFIIAGEASGDLHAANLMKGLKKKDPEAEFKFFGGDLMKAEGGTLIKHYAEMAFMGFVAVLLNLRKIQQNFRLCEKELLDFAPDVLLLVDYPGFNLRMAKFAKANNIRTFYYIAPKIWAWKENRIKKIKASVDDLFTIFPFETEFYKKFDYPVTFVGNPTVDELLDRECKDETYSTFIERNQLPSKDLVALVAGSRKSEVERMLPVMAEVSKRFPQYQFVVAGAPSLSPELYNSILEPLDANIKVVYKQTYELIQQSKAALVTSGTATLETAVIGTPQVVCFKMEFGRVASWLRPYFLKIPYFSLVNLILDQEAVLEIFQEKCTPDNVSIELEKLLHEEQYIASMKQNYAKMIEILEGPGGGLRAADEMVKRLNK